VTQAAPKHVPIIDPKYDWYQNATHSFISYKINNPEVGNLTNVTFEKDKVIMNYKDGEVLIELNLANDIVPE